MDAQKEQTKMLVELNEIARQQEKSMEKMAKKQKKISKLVRYGNVVNIMKYLKKNDICIYV